MAYVSKLLYLLKQCISLRLLNQGKSIHQKIIALSLCNNIILCKCLVDLYFSTDMYNSAKKVFVCVQNPFDISLCNGLMTSYTRHFMFKEALELFDELVCLCYLKPDRYTYPSALKACSGLSNIQFGQKIHTDIIKNGFLSDVVTTSSILCMYAKCGLLHCAINIFNSMDERDVPCWNAIISCYYQDGQCKKVLEVYKEMKSFGLLPNSVTLTTVISSCSRLMDWENGKKIHNELLHNGVLLDSYVSSALVDMYSRCGWHEMAEDVFEKIPIRDVVSWNALISGYSLKGDYISCLGNFQRMYMEGTKPTSTTITSLLSACSRSAQSRHGKFIHGYILRNRVQIDTFVSSSLVDFYFKCGCARLAESVSKEMPKTNVVSWNVLISGYVSLGLYFDALRVFNNMRDDDVKPDAITFTSILPACSQLAAIEHGRNIHKCIVENKFEKNEVVMGAVLDMYAKCGAVDEAVHVFDQLPEKDFVSWTSMITAYGTHGQAVKALELFINMVQSGAKPDRVTFLALLCACSHAGMVDEGCSYFNLMDAFGIKPTVEHYACLVDLLGRAGRLDEAYRILDRNSTIKEDVDLLSTLFSACNFYGDLELGESIARLIIEKDPNDSSVYITLSNMYARAKKWDRVRYVRSKFKALRLNKNLGCSWIEVNQKIHSFSAGDYSHPQGDMMSKCLDILTCHMGNDDKWLLDALKREDILLGS